MSQISAAPGGGPAFSAFINTTQSIGTGFNQKVEFDGENFDTDGNYDAATNYRFTPSKAGKYLLTCSVEVSAPVSGTYFELFIRKNGAAFSDGCKLHASNTNELRPTLAIIAEANGTTDYFECWVKHNHGASKNLTAGASRHHFDGCWLRA